MQPQAALDCKTHEMLKSRMRADLRVYRDAVNVLDELALGTTPQDFKRAHKLVEIARVAFEAARERFSEHVCSDRREVRYLRYLRKPEPLNRAGTSGTEGSWRFYVAVSDSWVVPDQ